VLEVLTLNFHAGRCTPEQWLIPWKIPGVVRITHFYSVFVVASPGRHRLLQHKQWTSDFARNKNVGALNQGNKPALLLAHLVLSIVPETRCSRIPEMQEENVMGHHHAWTTNESHLQIHVLQQPPEGSFIGNRGKQPQSDVVEDIMVPQVCLLQCLHANPRWTSEHFL
jgi:hypothetical protein